MHVPDTENYSNKLLEKIAKEVHEIKVELHKLSNSERLKEVMLEWEKSQKTTKRTKK